MAEKKNKVGRPRVPKRQKEKRKREYDNKYNLDHLKSITFRMSVEKDADIIEFISNLENKADWFRNVVRSEIGLKK